MNRFWTFIIDGITIWTGSTDSNVPLFLRFHKLWGDTNNLWKIAFAMFARCLPHWRIFCDRLYLHIYIYIYVYISIHWYIYIYMIVSKSICKTQNLFIFHSSEYAWGTSTWDWWCWRIRKQAWGRWALNYLLVPPSCRRRRMVESYTILWETGVRVRDVLLHEGKWVVGTDATLTMPFST